MRQSDKVNLPFFSMATLWFLSLDWSGTLRVIMLLLIRNAVAACHHTILACNEKWLPNWYLRP